MSVAGLRAWDDQGNPLIDMTRAISRVLGSFETGTGNGSITVALQEGTPFFIQVPLVPGGRYGKKAAVVYTGNGVFTWAFSYPGGIGNYSVNSRVYYGVY